MTDTGFQETLALLRHAPARFGEVSAFHQGRLQSWVIGVGVLLAVVLSAAAYL